MIHGSEMFCIHHYAWLCLLLGSNLKEQLWFKINWNVLYYWSVHSVAHIMACPFFPTLQIPRQGCLFCLSFKSFCFAFEIPSEFISAMDFASVSGAKQLIKMGRKGAYSRKRCFYTWDLSLFLCFTSPPALAPLAINPHMKHFFKEMFWLKYSIKFQQEAWPFAKNYFLTLLRQNNSSFVSKSWRRGLVLKLSAIFECWKRWYSFALSNLEIVQLLFG